MAERAYNPHADQWEERPDAPRPSYICGLDLGQCSDYTALAILEKNEEQRGGKKINTYTVRHLQRWINTSYPDIAEELRPMLARLDKPSLIVDNTGVGNAVTDILRKAALPVRLLVPCTITAGHTVSKGTKGGYNVPKKELCSVAQSALHQDRLVIVPKLKEAEALRKELGTFKTKINLNATESFEAWRESDKDDLVLACCMAVWYGEYCSREIILYL